MQNSLYLVVGLGKTGLSLARYLTKRNLPFVVFDTRPAVAPRAEFEATFPGVAVFLEHFPQEYEQRVHTVLVSPGVSLDEICLQRARARGIPIYGDIELFAQAVNQPVIAITGTNGKSTVTTLVGEMARAAGYCVAVGGNLGTPVLDLLDDATPYDWWVLELSSFQLEVTCSLAPRVASILNVSPDHLDRHGTLAQYTEAKRRIYQNAQATVYSREDAATVAILPGVNFGLDNPGQSKNWGIAEQDGRLFLAHGTACLVAVDELKIKGRHNWKNALAAAAIAHEAGFELAAIISVLKAFPGLPHRCQWVRTWDGIDFINDSKGTNIGATCSALEGIGADLAGKIVLIAGGMGKGADFSILRQPIAAAVRTLVLIGEDADKLEAVLSDLVPVIRCSSLEAAVAQAKLCAKPQDVVLLSPACASLDMFRDFNHRGDVFVQAVLDGR